MTPERIAHMRRMIAFMEEQLEEIRQSEEQEATEIEQAESEVLVEEGNQS